ncbi:hypothetical protein GE061_018591 [Apolygus lucorum]|uniref:Uncharacterized protein n=1 Tax=Apolygus lucorum TaxID=248454 RepID=A0A8S9XE69_APOLU|nr:hypothetical protein GE061_018591 [Apolygus lucorum]
MNRLFPIFSSSSSSSESDEDFQQLLEVVVPRRRIVRERVDHFNIWDDTDFFARFRLTKEGISVILDLIENSLLFRTESTMSSSPDEFVTNSMKLLEEEGTIEDPQQEPQQEPQPQVQPLVQGERTRLIIDAMVEARVQEAMRQMAAPASVKAKKAAAVRTIIYAFHKQTGQTFDEKQVLKKINNMKSKIKTKSDAKRTGNKKIKLAKWEQQFLELLQEEDNPTIALIPGACQAGFSGAGMDAAEGTDTLAGNNSKGTATCATISTSRYLQQTPAKPAKRTTSELRELETDETRKLSTGDLQSTMSSSPDEFVTNSMKLLEEEGTIEDPQQEPQQEPQPQVQPLVQGERTRLIIDTMVEARSTMSSSPDEFVTNSMKLLEEEGTIEDPQQEPQQEPQPQVQPLVQGERTRLIIDTMVEARVQEAMRQMAAPANAKRTGNKKIKLAKWEQQFLELLQEEDNPTIALIPGACQAGFSGAGMDAAEGTDTLAGNNSKGTATCATISTSRYLQQTPAKPAKRTTSELRELETDETRKLSTGDLQSTMSSSPDEFVTNSMKLLEEEGTIEDPQQEPQQEPQPQVQPLVQDERTRLIIDAMVEARVQEAMRQMAAPATQPAVATESRPPSALTKPDEKATANSEISSLIKQLLIQNNPGFQPTEPRPQLKTSDFFQRLNIQTSVEIDQGIDFTIDVQPDTRFPVAYIMYNITALYPDLETKGFPYVSTLSLAGYCLTLLYGQLLLNDINTRSRSSPYTHPFRTETDMKDFLEVITNLNIPECMQDILTKLTTFVDPQRPGLRYNANLASSLFLHDFVYLLPNNIFFIAHNILATTRTNADPSDILRMFYNTVIVSYQQNIYTIGNLLGAEFQQAQQNYLHKNWILTTFEIFFNPVIDRSLLQRPTLARINVTAPAFANPAADYNPYGYALTATTDDIPILSSALEHISNFFKKQEPNSKTLIQIQHELKGTTLLTYNVRPLELPTWHSLTSPTKNSEPPSILNDKAYAKMVNFLTHLVRMASYDAMVVFVLCGWHHMMPCLTSRALPSKSFRPLGSPSLPASHSCKSFSNNLRVTQYVSEEKNVVLKDGLTFQEIYQILDDEHGPVHKLKASTLLRLMLLS